MKQTITRLIDDEGAVSPVIGVILMVAITVILAAVIGTFVLGLGGQVSQTAPQASISVQTVSASANTVTLKHGGSDTIKAADTKIEGTEDANGTTTTFSLTTSGDADWSTAGTIVINTNTPDVSGGSSGWSGLSWTSNGGSFTLDSGDDVTLTFVDSPSGQIIAESSFTV